MAENIQITGKTLISMGYKPGKWFKAAIAHANKNALSGKRLREYLDSMVPRTISPHDQPVDFHKNIRAESPEEQDNLNSVLETMNVLLKTPTLVGGAVMPDACPAGSKGQIPVGGIAIARNAIHPTMHSVDICCSVMITNLGFIQPKDILDAAQSLTHFGGSGREDNFDLPSNLT